MLLPYWSPLIFSVKSSLLKSYLVICEALIARIGEGIRLSCMCCITNLQLNYVTVICTNVYTMMRFDVSDTFKIEPYACEMTSYVGSRYRINQKEISAHGS